MNFTSVTLEELDSASPSEFDSANFGIVQMSHDGVISAYNTWQEREFATTSRDEIIGKHFFSQIAPCTNNFMVSGRFEMNQQLDETLDYTFSVKMVPTEVKLRLIKGQKQQYFLCHR